MNVRLIHRHFLVPAEEPDKAMFHFRPEHVISIERVLPVARQLDRNSGLSEPDAITGNPNLGPKRFPRTWLVPSRQIREKKHLDALGFRHFRPGIEENTSPLDNW